MAQRFNGACRLSFVAGTEISTPDGSKPIEAFCVGAEVLTKDQDAPCEAPTVSRVTRLFRHVAPAILWVVLVDGASLGMTPDHEVWTHEQGWMLAEDLDPGDTFMDANSEPLAVESTWLDPTPTLVYNFRVGETATYFAEGVWVHNCGARRLWGITREGTERVMKHNNPHWGKFYKSKSDGLWWAKDSTGHGESVWKVFEQNGNNLIWKADANEFGTFIEGKHKGPTNLIISMKDLAGASW